MKKRLLSALLALALVFVLLPTTALAGETTGKEDYDISINGKGWKFEWDNTSGAYIPAYYYHTNEFSADENYRKLYTNDNLMLTKEGNTVTITIRRGTSHDYRVYPIEFTLEKKSTTSGSPYDYTPCIEMGNNNNLVITGKGTLNITRDEKNGIGAALCSEVGDITITDGITVKANFLKQVSNSTVGNAISVKDHNLIISGKNTKVEARNSSCNFQDLYDVSATVCVENGEIKVSDGATLSAINNFTNSYTSQYSYYSRAISGSSSKPCALTVTGENSCVIAETDNSLGKAYGHVNFSIDGAKIEVGTSSPAQTITDINNIKNYKYAKISVPALQRTSDVLIAKENAVVGQWTNIPAAATGTGSYYYDADKKELTLKDVNITHSDGAIVQFMAGAPYIIKLEGTNSIKDVSSFIRVPEDAYESLDGISVTISGSGSLEVTARGNAITMLKGDLVFNNTGAITLETNTLKGKAINVSGNISIGDDFNKNLRITADNGDMTFDPTNQYTDYNDLKNYKSITIASKPSETYYNGTAMKYGETRTAGSGTIFCDENGVITLNGATKGTLEFRSSADSTLVLKGTNTLSSIVTTQKGLTISDSGSLTVGSIKVHNQKTSSDDKPNLTINGATVTVGTAELTTRAIDIDGNLTVTNGSLKATSTSDSVPTVQVGGNASFTGSTVTITNNSTTQGERYKDSYEVSSALHVNGAVTISGGTVMAEAKAGGNAIRAVGNITVSNDATVTAKNNSQYFNAITAGSATGGEVNTLYNLIVSGENTRITATNAHDNNLTYGGAINAYIKNANEGHYLKVGTDTKAIAPNAKTTVRNNSLTITRGDEVTRTNSPVVIAGTTLLNDTYYTITNGSTVAEGTENNYNAFYNSTTKTLKLNNAQISHSFAHEYGDGTDGAIIFKEYKNYCIELSGTNTISSMNTYAINGDTNSLTIKNAAGTENAKLTLTGNWTAICSTEGLNIQSDVTMVNTKRADHLMYVNGTFSFDGYNAYASVNASGSPLVEYTVPTSGEKDAGYQYLRITKETLETGGSTHQHTYDQSAWKSDATHHWQECTDPNCPDPTKGITNKASHSFSNGACTVCGYRGQTEEHHFGTEWFSNAEYHWHKCTDEGCDAISGKAPHEWTGWRIDEPSPGMHNRFCNCGYNDYSHHYNLVYAAAGEAGHYQYCTLGNCTFKTSTVPHNYDGDTCTICNYTKSGEIVPPTPDNPGTIVIIRPAEEEKPAQQPNPSTGANDLVGLAVAAAVAAALGSAALLRKHD